MCCAVKSTLLNVVLWILALIGLAPVTPVWVDSIEGWIGYERPVQPIVHTYVTTEDRELYAYEYTLRCKDSQSTRPAVLTAFHTRNLRSLPSTVYTICSDLAQMGYAVIAFEIPGEEAGASGEGAIEEERLAMTWLEAHSDGLGVDLSRTMSFSIFGQPVLTLSVDRQLERRNTVGLGYIVVPEGAKRFPSELSRFLPALP